MLSGQGADHQPLGYLVKRLDSALTDYVDRLLGKKHGLGRSHWQLLRTVSVQPGVKRSEFAESSQIFYDEDRLRELISDLVARGWLLVEERNDAADGPRLWLTDMGERGYRELVQTQESSWTTLMRGLDEADYELVVTRLERMIDNLESASL